MMYDTRDFFMSVTLAIYIEEQRDLRCTLVFFQGSRFWNNSQPLQDAA